MYTFEDLLLLNVLYGKNKQQQKMYSAPASRLVTAQRIISYIGPGVKS